MRVIWTLGAQDDARELALMVHEHGPKAARRLIEELALAAERLADSPRLGVRADNQGLHRYFLVARGRYRMSYRIDPDAVRIVGFSRGTEPWSDERS